MVPLFNLADSIDTEGLFLATVSIYLENINDFDV